MCGIVEIPTFAVKLVVELIPLTVNGLSLIASGNIVVVMPAWSPPCVTAPAVALTNLCIAVVPIPTLIVIVSSVNAMILVAIPAIGSVPPRGYVWLDP